MNLSDYGPSRDTDPDDPFQIISPDMALYLLICVAFVGYTFRDLLGGW